jgi:methylmalonyl-CoA mutase
MSHRLITFGDMQTKATDKDLFPEFRPQSLEEWKQKIVADLKGAGWDEQLVWHSPEGLNIQPIYRKEQLPEGLPATVQYPRSWEIRQEFDIRDADADNRLIQHALKNGVEAIGLYLSEPMGRAEMEKLLDEVYIEMITVHWYGKGAAPAFEAYLEIAKARGIDNKDLWGTIWAKAAAELCQKYAADYPGLGFLTAALDHDISAKLNMVEQIAALAAEGEAQLDKFPDFDPNRITFYTEIGPDYFREIAKCRALRQVWANVIEARGGEAQPGAMGLHTTNAISKRHESPYQNLLQATTTAMAAAIGGSCSIALLAMNDKDAQRDLDTTFFQRINNNIQLLLKHESHLNEVADPLAGSYYVEHLTAQYLHQAWPLFAEISEIGLSKWLKNREE